MKTPAVKAVRCAIYTRVSTDHGLDQEFNSLDAQYDAASAYIKESGSCRLDHDPKRCMDSNWVDPSCEASA